MDIDYIKELIKLVEESKISELEVSRRFTRIRITRYNNNRYKNNYKPPIKVNIEKKIEQEESFLKSPIVGTFYRSPGPDIEPYKKEGDEIKKGEIYGIIEAMKLNNEMEYKNDEAVIIEKFLVNNGQAVEYNQKLAIIKPKTNEH